MKMSIGSFKQTNQEKIKSLIETRKIDESLIKHYTFILNHFDEIIATHDKDIVVIEAKKAEILKQFIEAPEKLIQLNAHLAEIQKRIKDTKDITTNRTQKINRIKSLRERLAVLKEECEAEGINVEAVLNNS